MPNDYSYARFQQIFNTACLPVNLDCIFALRGSQWSHSLSYRAYRRFCALQFKDFGSGGPCFENTSKARIP